VWRPEPKSVWEFVESNSVDTFIGRELSTVLFGRVVVRAISSARILSSDDFACCCWTAQVIHHYVPQQVRRPVGHSTCATPTACIHDITAISHKLSNLVFSNEMLHSALGARRNLCKGNKVHPFLFLPSYPLLHFYLPLPRPCLLPYLPCPSPLPRSGPLKSS